MIKNNDENLNRSSADELEIEKQVNATDVAAEEALAEQTDIPAQDVTMGVDSAVTPAAVAEGEKAEESLADRVRIVSPFKLVIKRFFRSRLSVVGLTVFLAVLIFSFLGPVFVPWEEKEVDRSPSQLEYRYLTHTNINPETGEKYDYYLIPINQTMNKNEHAEAWSYGVNNKGEKALHVLGTDRDGRDIFVRLMYGGRLSLSLSFLVVLIYTFLGIILGGLAGYFGGWVDMIIMRIVDILNCIPSLPILLIVGAIFDGLGWDQAIRIYVMLGALTLLSWPGTARLVRGQILFLREQEYMVAADALGFSVGRKIFKHLVPNVMPQLIVSMTLGLGGTILSEASLSFLGLGAPPDFASLGQMVSLATNDLTILQYYVADWLPAGIIIILAVVAFNFIGDGLRDALDPKMKR